MTLEGHNNLKEKIKECPKEKETPLVSDDVQAQHAAIQERNRHEKMLKVYYRIH